MKKPLPKKKRFFYGCWFVVLGIKTQALFKVALQSASIPTHQKGFLHKLTASKKRRLICDSYKMVNRLVSA